MVELPAMAMMSPTTTAPFAAAESLSRSDYSRAD